MRFSAAAALLLAAFCIRGRAAPAGAGDEGEATEGLEKERDAPAPSFGPGRFTTTASASRDAGPGLAGTGGRAEARLISRSAVGASTSKWSTLASNIPRMPVELWLMAQEQYTNALRLRTAIDNLVPDDPSWPRRWRAAPKLAVEMTMNNGNGTLLRYLFADPRDFGLDRLDPGMFGLTCLHVSRGSRMEKCSGFPGMVSNKSASEATPLHLADDKGIRLLVDAGADCNAQAHPRTSYDLRWSPLSLALRRGASASSVDVLLECSNHKIRQQSLPFAAGAGNKAVTALLLADVDDGVDGDFVVHYAFQLASDRQDEDVMSLLLETERVSDEAIGDAYAKAARLGHLRTMAVVFATARVDDEAIDNAYEEAAGSGRLDTMAVAFATMRVSDEAIGDAYEAAAGSGRLDTMAVAFATTRVSDEAIGDAYEAAASSGHLDTMAVAFATKRVSDEAIGFACAAAAGSGHVDAMARALETKRVSDHWISVACYNAARAGHIDAIANALETGRVNQEHMSKTCEQAARSGALPLMSLLWESGRVAKSHFGETYAGAAKEGNSEMMKAAFSAWPTAINSINAAYEAAARGGHVDAMATASFHGRITDESIGRALCGAASAGRHIVAAAILGSGRATKAQVEECGISALDAGRADMGAFLALFFAQM